MSIFLDQFVRTLAKHWHTELLRTHSQRQIHGFRDGEKDL